MGYNGGGLCTWGRTQRVSVGVTRRWVIMGGGMIWGLLGGLWLVSLGFGLDTLCDMLNRQDRILVRSRVRVNVRVMPHGGGRGASHTRVALRGSSKWEGDSPKHV